MSNDKQIEAPGAIRLVTFIGAFCLVGYAASALLGPIPKLYCGTAAVPPQDLDPLCTVNAITSAGLAIGVVAFFLALSIASTCFIKLKYSTSVAHVKTLLICSVFAGLGFVADLALNQI